MVSKHSLDILSTFVLFVLNIYSGMLHILLLEDFMPLS